ncbi:MAG: bifunctional DNA primase/polymerase [Pseudomonadota bacterium]|nr:bifunctional DNA primase/polymerase [Pseudomonadota bacterium]
MNTNDINDVIPNFSDLSAMGWSFFILPRGRKEPSGSWKGFQSARPTPAQVADWEGELANVGIVTGRLSNLLVIDVDSDEAQTLIDGMDLPATPTVRTAKGRHYYFKHPATEVRNKVNLQGVRLDLRGEGGYVVGPGSQHPDGAIYSWEVSPEDCPIADLPQAVLGQLIPSCENSLVTQSESGDFVEAGPFSVWVNREVQKALADIRNAKEGERNNTLFRSAARLANHAAALNLDWSHFELALRPEAKATGMTGEEVAATLQSAWSKGSKTPTEWLYIARNWIYVASRDRFWSPSADQELAPRAFSMNFAAANPFEKGRLADILTNGGLVETVLDFRFDPSQPSGVITVRGEQFYNTYRAPDIEAVDGDCTPFIEFCRYLVPDNAEREHLLQMMAWTIANPGEKLTYALLLQSKQHGVGKSTLIEIWRSLLGRNNTRLTTSDEMDGGYQSYIADKVLVVLEELNLGSGITAYNRLKSMITENTVVINEKYVKQREAPNLANFVFLSNLDAPLFIEQDDRRFFVIDTPAQKREPEYWTEFHSWWRSNLGVVKAHLASLDLSEFQPKATPPMTVAKEKLKRNSSTPLAQALAELIEERSWPISREVCTVGEIRRELSKAGFRNDTPRKISTALKEIGCAPLDQVRLTDGTRKTFWALIDVEKWQGALPSAIREAFENPSRLGSMVEAA